MSHGEAGTPAPRAARLGAPRGASPPPGEEGRAGAWWSPGGAGAADGSPHVSTSPTPAPRRRGGREERLRPMPTPSWIPVSSHMKAARSEPAERRPSLLQGGQRGPAHSAGIETQKEAFDGQGGRSPLPLPPSTAGPPPPPRARASLSSPLGLTHSAPLPSGRRTFGRSYFSVLLASRLDGDVKPTKCPRRVAGATRGPPSARQRPWLGRKALSALSSLALRAQPPDKTPLLGPASQPLTGGSDLLPQHRQRGPRSAAPFCLCMAGRPLS